ncbi:MAG: hypothetical protein IPN92_07045 [Chromatiaceae bacterium]|nr:hypothetical protein [Chromatiaceae bacterium]
MNEIDWAHLASDWLQFVVAGACGGGLALWAALGRRERAFLAQLQGLATRIAAEQAHQDQLLTKLENGRVTTAECVARGQRMAALESALRLGVSHEDLKRAHVRMDTFESKLGHITGLLEGLGHALERVEQHLLAHGPRAGDHP